MNRSTIDTNLLRQIVFIAVIIFLGIVLFNQLWFFLPAFLGAVTFYVLMRERMFYLTEVKGWGYGSAAWVLMLLSFFVILLPTGLLGNILYSMISYVVAHSIEILNSMQRAADQISKKIGYEIINPNAINKIGTY